MTTWTEDSNNNLIVNFDTAAVPPDSYDLLPDGDYSVVIKKVEMKPTKDGSGTRMNVQLSVVGEKFANRVIFDAINVVLPSSEKAEAIGRKQLASLLAACGKSGTRDMSVIIGEEVICKVRTQPAQNGYEARNVVRGYRSPGVVAPVPPAPAPVGEKKPPAFMGKKGPPALAK